MELGLNSNVFPHSLLHNLNQLGCSLLVVGVNILEVGSQLLEFGGCDTLLILKSASKACNSSLQLSLFFPALNLVSFNILGPEMSFLEFKTTTLASIELKLQGRWQEEQPREGRLSKEEQRNPPESEINQLDVNLWPI